MKNKLVNKIFVCCFTFIIALLSILPLFSNKTKVFADEDVLRSDFYSSNIFIPISISSDGQAEGFLNFRYEIIDESSTQNDYKTYRFNWYIESNNDFTWSYIDIYKTNIAGQITTSTLHNTNTYLDNYSIDVVSRRFVFYYFLSDTLYSFSMTINSPLNFDFTIPFVHLYSESSENVLYYPLSNDSIDSAFIRFEFPCANSFYSFKSRFYYFTDSMNDNDSYLNGLAQGRLEGFQNGEDSGYRDGYSKGYTDGKSAGIDIGVEQGANYSFLTLFGAVVDAPLQALSGMLNFSILGYNLLSLFYALITIAIFIGILRIFL